MLCANPWEARPFLNEDAGRVHQEGVDGKGEWIGREEVGKLVGMLKKVI